MGVWGVGIFSDDLVADLRNEFTTYIGDGKSADEATAMLVAGHRDSIEDSEEGPLFWIGLAAIQWKMGRLLPDVRDRAIRAIEDGSDLRRWEDDPPSLRKRKKVLEGLREQLNTLPPPPKKVSKRYIDENDWAVGTVVAYRSAEGRYRLFRVVGHHSDMGGVSPIVEIFDWVGDAIPSLAEVRAIKSMVVERRESDKARRIMIGALTKREYPADRITIVGVLPKLSLFKEFRSYTVCRWRDLDESLERLTSR